MDKQENFVAYPIPATLMNRGENWLREVEARKIGEYIAYSKNSIKIWKNSFQLAGILKAGRTLSGEIGHGSFIGRRA